MNGIQAIRKQLGMTQKEFAAELRMTQANVSAYEARGQTVPPLVALDVVRMARERGFDCCLDHVYSPATEMRRLAPAEA